MSLQDDPAAQVCLRFIHVCYFPKGYWRARLVCRLRNREFIGLPKPTMSEAIRAAYLAAGDPNGMGLPIFGHRGNPLAETRPLDPRRHR